MSRAGAFVLLFLGLWSIPALAGPVTLLSKADPAQPSGTAGGAARVAGVSSDGRHPLHHPFVAGEGTVHVIVDVSGYFE